VSKSFRFICDADGAGKPPGPAHFLSVDLRARPVVTCKLDAES